MGFIGPFAEEAADLIWLRLSQSINLRVQDSQFEAYLQLACLVAQLWPTIVFHIFHISIDSYSHRQLLLVACVILTELNLLASLPYTLHGGDKTVLHCTM